MTLDHDDRLRTQAVLATAVTCLTVLFALAFTPMMSFGALPLFLVPVLISADMGRRRAGLIATAVSIPLAAYIFVPPAWSFDIGSDGLMRLTLFAVDAVLISVLVGSERQVIASPA